jgi:tetrahydromethanopterin S-methyltransferase subunit E
VFDPILGFYVDGPLVARHGLRDDFDPVAFCAAFGVVVAAVPLGGAASV